ncbi:cytidine deaminase-like protein [Mucidula mucida]|nr:cytidine deaminase-like protein [Mucidula mucida]
MPSQQPQHLNNSGCSIQYSEGKGRGVYANRRIPKQTTIEISPVLLFSSDEYENHGKHTILDHYTFKWRDGRMALALGLGSLFNHSDVPNVSYELDHSTDSIRYITTRVIESGQELCIFYGHPLWFSDANGSSQNGADVAAEDDEFSALPMIFESENNADDIVAEDDLPFTRLKPPPEEEDMTSIRKAHAWVVDVPDPRHLTILLKWLKKSGLDSEDLGHLKRVRKQDSQTRFLLTALPICPPLPAELELPEPVLLPVPASAALTPTQLALKSSLWPTIYAPRRKGETEPWTYGKMRWAKRAMKHTVAEARKARVRGELPIAAYVPIPYDTNDPLFRPITALASDTRTSTAHPLRHCCQNLVRTVGDQQGVPSGQVNGAHYLLTSLSLFITHEPCIMCSMALLHSRVKEIFYILPMDKTGGCGGATCLPTLPGVNHRFTIWRWTQNKQNGMNVDDIRLNDAIDV